jgi:hypothetical protein
MSDLDRERKEAYVKEDCCCQIGRGGIYDAR